MAAVGEGTILSIPQDLTASWIDLGAGDIETLPYSFITIFPELIINDSKDVQIRAVVEYDIGEDLEFTIPTLTIKKDITEMLEKPRQYKLDEDHNMAVSFEMDQTFKLITIQVRALTVGATPGQITRARYRQGYRQ